MILSCYLFGSLSHIRIRQGRSVLTRDLEYDMDRLYTPSLDLSLDHAVESVSRMWSIASELW